MPCAGERGRPFYKMLKSLRTTVKKVGRTTIADWKKRWDISEETGQEDLTRVKARVKLARSSSAMHALWS